MAESVGTQTGIDLYWLPLGAGGHCVRWNGRVMEAVSAAFAHRPASDLYHSALTVHLPHETVVIEMTPVWQFSGGGRGVFAEGAVGARWAGRSRLFRYEVHAWRDGTISDVAEAVASPVHLPVDETACRRLLAALPEMPVPVWGRDELDTGDMWNSNSVTSWSLVRSGVDVGAIAPPAGGRAPGWDAGVAIAGRG